MMPQGNFGSTKIDPYLTDGAVLCILTGVLAVLREYIASHILTILGLCLILCLIYLSHSCVNVLLLARLPLRVGSERVSWQKNYGKNNR